MNPLDLKSPAVQRTVLSVLMCAAVLGTFFFTHALPFTFPSQRDRLSALKGEHEKKSGELARARATVADLPRFEAEYERLHDRWTMAAELLPTDRQMAALLRKITLSAQQTGVEFVVFRPTEVRTELHYTELPLQISVYGGYHQIGSFIAELANMRRILTVASLHLKSGPKSDVATTAAEFTASAYSLNATAGDAPQASTPPAASTPPSTDRKQGDAHAHRSS